jgi:hypothetical protein
MGIAACGRDVPTVVVRVGQVPITKSKLAHWMLVISRDGVAAPPHQRRQRTRQQALEFLISSDWLIG